MPTYRLKEKSVQYNFNRSRAKMQFMGGGFGNGKTTALAIKFIEIAEGYPGCNLLLGRATYAKLNDSLRKEFFKWCPPGAIKRMPTKDDNTCIFHNGSVINFRYISQRGKTAVDGQTTSNLLSNTYDAIGIDQAEDPEIQHKDILDMMGRLRGQTPYQGTDPTMPDTGPRWLVLTANPTMNWIFHELIKPYKKWKKTGVRDPKLLVDAAGVPILELFEGSTYTNASNLPADFIAGMEATYKGQQFDRFVMGKWAAYEGLVYGAYDPSIHELTRDEILDHLYNCKDRHVDLQVLEGYDFGLTSPSCYMYAFVDDWGRVFILDGYYEPNFQYDLQPPAIKDIRKKYSNMLRVTEPIRADPSIFKKQVVAKVKNTGDTVNALLSNKSKLRFTPANNDIAAGIAKVTAYLAGRRDVTHPTLGTKNAPLLYVNRDLSWFNDEIMNYFWKKNPQGVKLDEPQDNNDHAMDTTKYLIAHLPEPSDIVIPADKLPPGWMQWHEMEDA